MERHQFTNAMRQIEEAMQLDNQAWIVERGISALSQMASDAKVSRDARIAIQDLEIALRHEVGDKREKATAMRQATITAFKDA